MFHIRYDNLKAAVSRVLFGRTLRIRVTDVDAMVTSGAVPNARIA